MTSNYFFDHSLKKQMKENERSNRYILHNFDFIFSQIFIFKKNT